MKPKTLTIQLNDEQLPILPVEPEAHLSFTTHAAPVGESRFGNGRNRS